MKLRDRIRQHLPPLEREERIALLARVESGAGGSVDFYAMMLLSAGLASLGLLEDSTAVVIGAMLVAPLMGPLIGAGFGLAQGNLMLYRTSLAVAVRGLLVGFAVSFAMGMLNPGFEPTLEVEARGNPDILDLGVAIISGLIAAYAMTRAGVANTLAGVAIAAALVPPLCVVGIGLTNDQPLVAFNSAILLMTNLVAIILAAAAAFRVLGVHVSSSDGRATPWVRSVLVVLVMLTIALLPPLMQNVVEQKRLGQSRPLTYPMAAHVHEALKAYLDSIPDVTLVRAARVSVEPASAVHVLLATPGTLPAGTKDELTRIVHEARGGKPSVHIIALKEVVEQP